VCKALKILAQAEARLHVESLTLQGALITAVSTTLSKGFIKRWSLHIDTVAASSNATVRICQKGPVAATAYRSKSEQIG